MKKIICYLLISNLLMSQDNVEIIEEEILPKDDNVIENVNQDSDKEDEDKDILTSPIIKNLSEREQHLYLDLKERAHDELKAYTDYWKARIAVNDIAESGNTDTRSTCLLQGNNNCVHTATLSAVVADVSTAPIEGINDNENSRIIRKALSTSIKWQFLIHGEQKIEFYVEQLVLNK